ncbi:COP23 domain-containing protein [Nostoc flagelliforme]|nr:COP23 domain-containing protein [Nostoc flagelliforme]
MHKQPFFIGLGLAICTVFTNLSIIFPSFSQSSPSKSQPAQTTFVCGKKMDQSSGDTIPVTAAWIPEKRGHVYFIGWKSEYFNQGGWTPQKRCEQVTQKFQEFYSQNRLNYISSGKHNGYPVICGVTNLGEICNGSNQLFTVRSGSNPDELIRRLMDIAEGKTSEPLLQNSGKQTYIPVQAFLVQSPIIDIQGSRNTQR